MAGVLITDNADGLVEADGELLENPEGPAPGVSTYVFTDAVGTSYCYDRVLPDLPADPGTYGAAGVEGPVGGPTGNTLNTPNNELFYVALGLGVHRGPTGRRPEPTSANPYRPAPDTGSGVTSNDDGRGTNSGSANGGCTCSSTAPNIPSAAIVVKDSNRGDETDLNDGLANFPVGIQFSGEGGASADIDSDEEGDAEEGASFNDYVRFGLFAIVNPAQAFTYLLIANPDVAEGAANVAESVQNDAQAAINDIGTLTERVVSGTATPEDWERLKAAGSTLGHGVLDLIGMIPIEPVGAVADTVNALWYAAEEKWLDAAISGLSAIPGIGTLIAGAWKGAKLGILAAKTATEAGLAAGKFYSAVTRALNNMFGGGHLFAAYHGKVSAVIGAVFVTIGKMFPAGAVGKVDEVVDVAKDVKAAATHAPSVGDIRAAGGADGHHVIQDAAVRDLPGYDTNKAPGVALPGPPCNRTTPHGRATAVQRQAGGGTYAAERRIGYKALRRAGLAASEAKAAVARADAYFKGIGVGPKTPTRIPGNRPRKAE